MRTTYTISAIMEKTGFSWAFISRFVPYVLKPNGWDKMGLHEKQYALLKLHGLTLKFVKSDKGHWICNQLDFHNQVKRTGFQNRTIWL